MNIKELEDGKTILITSNDILFHDEQSALDFIANLTYGTEYYNIIIYMENLESTFFDLSTKIAGLILQKFVNYHVKLAIIGDFKKFDSNSLNAFIYESNKGKDFFFIATLEEAILKLDRI